MGIEEEKFRLLENATLQDLRLWSLDIRRVRAIEESFFPGASPLAITLRAFGALCNSWLCSQGFKANPGLELANAFSVQNAIKKLAFQA